MTPFKLLTQNILAQTATQAQANPRLRQNYNFHEPAERVQRFINMLQPGTYVRPHCHLRPVGVHGFEFFLVLQGTLGFLVLDELGQILHTQRLTAQGEVWGLELAQGQYHTLIALEPNTAILEIKEGPYDPQTDKCFLTSFPAEGTAAAASWVKTWERVF
jgi:cupin fold WbuC family metalloprotein